jgi:hypothetical protein
MITIAALIGGAVVGIAGLVAWGIVQITKDVEKR